MNRKCPTLILAALTLMAAGCSKQMSKTAPASAAYAMSPQRYIAERHKLEIIASEAEIQKLWDSTIALCGAIQCEVVSSTITTRTGGSVPSGTVSLRVAPEDLKKLLGQVEKLGKLAQHTTEREDKTTAVVDTEAKIKNLTTFRDNLRVMLSKPSATVKDLVEIQKELTDTQAELDSETTQRKILANETEKIVVEISFHVERSGGSSGWAQIWSALRESGPIFADSTASLITTIVAIVPWLVLIVPSVWLVVRVWRKVRVRRSQSRSPSPAAPPTSV